MLFCFPVTIHKLKDKAARSTAELLQTIENKIEVENNPRKKKALQDLKGRIDFTKLTVCITMKK